MWNNHEKMKSVSKYLKKKKIIHYFLIVFQFDSKVLEKFNYKYATLV